LSVSRLVVFDGAEVAYERGCPSMAAKKKVAKKKPASKSKKKK